MIDIERSKLKQFINNSLEVLDGEEGYCIIVYVAGKVYKIYKSVNDFEAKAEKDIQRIDPMFDINFQIWLYD